MPSELQTAFSASQLQRERTQTVIPAKNRKSKAWATSCVRYAHCQETILPFSIFGKLSCNAQKPKHFCVNFVLNSVNLSMNSCSFSFV
ncbi:TPA: hypothetical protein WI003_001589 [Neisseria meningitidis]